MGVTPSLPRPPPPPPPRGQFKRGGDRFQGFNPRRRRKIESDMGTQSRKYEMPKVYLFYIEEKRNISREHFIFGKCVYGEKLTF